MPNGMENLPFMFFHSVFQRFVYEIAAWLSFMELPPDFHSWYFRNIPFVVFSPDSLRGISAGFHSMYFRRVRFAFPCPDSIRVSGKNLLEHHYVQHPSELLPDILQMGAFRIAAFLKETNTGLILTANNRQQRTNAG